MPEAQTTPEAPATPALPPNRREVKVQLEDGSIESFVIDTRTDPATLPRVIEGALRARTRQKAVKAGTARPEPGVEPPPMTSSSLGSTVMNAASGAAEVPIGLARDFVSGARQIARAPITDTLSLFPEGIMNLIRQGRESIGRAISTPSVESPPITGHPRTAMVHAGFALGGLPGAGLAAVASRLGASRSADLISAIPIVGPRATEFGERVAAGEGGKAVGNLAATTALDVASAKGAGRLMERARPTPVEPPPTPEPVGTPTPRHMPEFTGQLQGSGKSAMVPEIPESRIPEPTVTRKLGDIPVTSEYPRKVDWGEVGSKLKEALKDVPDTKATVAARKAAETAAQPKPTRIRLPFLKLGRLGIPATLEITAPRLTMIKSLMSTARGSAEEAIWAQRILEGIGTDDKEDHTRPERRRNILGLE